MATSEERPMAWTISFDSQPTESVTKRSFTEALREKYIADDTNCQHNNGFVIKIDIRGKPKDHTKGKAELGFLRNVVLCSNNISYAGLPDHGLEYLCPNVVDLDLSYNVITSWNDIITLLGHLPQLKYVNFAGNPLKKDQEVLQNDALTLPAVENLVLNRTHVSWNEVAMVCQRLPTMRELHICGNDYQMICEESVTSMRNIECLRLNDNSIRRWTEIAKLSGLPNLKSLIISENPLEDVFYETDPIQDVPAVIKEVPQETKEDASNANVISVNTDKAPSEETEKTEIESVTHQCIVHAASAVCQNIINEVFENVCLRGRLGSSGERLVSQTMSQTENPRLEHDSLWEVCQGDTRTRLGQHETECTDLDDTFKSTPQISTHFVNIIEQPARNPDDSSKFSEPTEQCANSESSKLDQSEKERVQDDTSITTLLDSKDTQEECDKSTNASPEGNISQNQLGNDSRVTQQAEDLNVGKCVSVNRDLDHQHVRASDSNPRLESSEQPSHVPQVPHTETPDQQCNEPEILIGTDQCKSERALPFTALECLNVSNTAISSFDDLQALAQFPKLKTLRIKNKCILPNLSQDDRRKMIIACLPNVLILNGSEVSPSERSKSEGHFLQYFKTSPDPPPQYERLVQKHGKPSDIVDIDLRANFCEWADVTLVYENDPLQKLRVHVTESVGTLRKQVRKALSLSRGTSFRMYHYACGPYHMEPEVTFDELFLNSLPLSRFNLLPGDEIHIERFAGTVKTMTGGNVFYYS